MKDTPNAILFVPQKWRTTHYLTMMIEAYKEAGVEVRQQSFLKIFLPKNKDVDFITINSLEGNIAKQSNIFAAYIILYIFKIYLLMVSKLLKIKIIWVFHDKEVHERVNLKYAKIANKMFDFYPKIADVVMIHSKSSTSVLIEKYGRSIEKKIKYVAHPNFIGWTGKFNPVRSISNDNLHLLCLGGQEPYKNTDMIIDVLSEISNDNIILTIAGGASSEYEKVLVDKINNSSAKINYSFKRVNDEDMALYYSKSHLVLLPYNLDSSMNSGALINALSYARTVLSSENGTLLDLKHKGVTFSYHYENSSTHKEQFKKELLNIVNQYKGQYDRLITLGEKGYKLMNQENSKYIVACQIKEMIKYKMES